MHRWGIAKRVHPKITGLIQGKKSGRHLILPNSIAFSWRCRHTLRSVLAQEFRAVVWEEREWSTEVGATLRTSPKTSLVCGNPTWLEMPPYSMMNPAKKTSIYSGFSSQGGFPEGLWRPFSLDLGRFVELNRDDSWNLLDLFVECDLLDYIQHFFFFVIPTDLRGGYYLGTTDVKTSPGSRLSQVNGGVPSLEGLVVVAGCRHCGRFLMGTSTF